MQSLLLFALFSFAFAHQCTFNSSGYFYDFSRMRELGDLVATTPRGSYYFQVCSEVVSHCGNAQSSVCLKSGDKAINLGNTASAQWSIRSDSRKDEGVTIEYSEGDLCGADKTPRKTVVNLICHVDPSPFKANPTFQPNKREVNQFGSDSTIQTVEDSDDCTTQISVRTPFACAVNKKFFTECGYRVTREDCFASGSSSDCHCSWCSGVCMATYEKCPAGVVEFECHVEIRSIGSGLLVGMIMIAISFCLLSCLCVCACIKKRRYNKLREVRQKMQVVHSRNSEDIAMQPFLQPEMPVMDQEVQFVYVQVPMVGTDQQHPPYFAPQPFYFAPQFVQPAERTQ